MGTPIIVALKARVNQTTNDLSNYTHLEVSDHGSLERSQKKPRLSEHSVEAGDGSRPREKKNPIGIKKASMGNLRAQRAQRRPSELGVMEQQTMNQCMSQRNFAEKTHST